LKDNGSKDPSLHGLFVALSIAGTIAAVVVIFAYAAADVPVTDALNISSTGTLASNAGLELPSDNALLQTQGKTEEPSVTTVKIEKPVADLDGPTAVESVGESSPVQQVTSTSDPYPPENQAPAQKENEKEPAQTEHIQNTAAPDPQPVAFTPAESTTTGNMPVPENGNAQANANQNQNQNENVNTPGPGPSIVFPDKNILPLGNLNHQSIGNDGHSENGHDGKEKAIDQKNVKDKEHGVGNLKGDDHGDSDHEGKQKKHDEHHGKKGNKHKQ